MRSVPVRPEAMNEFFGVLVGSEAARQDVQALLASKVQAAPPATPGLYVRLEDGMKELVSTTSRDLDGPFDERIAIATNGLTGVRATIGALHAVDRVYQQFAEVPQRQGTVEHSAEVTVRHIFKIAFSERETARRNLRSFYAGIDPQQRSVFGKVRRSRATHTNVSPESFAVTQDTDGQVSVLPRFQHVKAPDQRRCPATGARVGDTSRSALLTLMDTISNVAVTEIYPRHFPIITPEPTPGITEQGS